MSSPARVAAMPPESAYLPARAAAEQRLSVWLAGGASAYAKRRNFDFGPSDRSNVSGLSPYVRHRLILESEILAATLSQFPLRRVDKFVQEVFWRTYFKGWLEHRPGVWHGYTGRVLQLVEELGCDAGLRAAYDRAVEGRTGIDCFDAWVQELRLTGYLHNHARMWFASIWIFTLKLPWELGADFFMQHLLDGDAAANTCSWRWVGGLHTQGKTYLARASNIREYTAGRFDPGDDLAEVAIPVAGSLPPQAQAIRVADTAPVDGTVGLLLTDDDCDPVSLAPDVEIQTCHALQTASLRSPMSVAEHVLEFSAGALDDGLRRFSDNLQDNARVETGDSVDGVLDWAARWSLDTVVIADPPQGASADVLTTLEPALRARGIRLIRMRRQFDDLVWPHARKGFFGLKKKIPALLTDMGFDVQA